MWDKGREKGELIVDGGYSKKHQAKDTGTTGWYFRNERFNASAAVVYVVYPTPLHSLGFLIGDGCPTLEVPTSNSSSRRFNMLLSHGKVG